MTRRSFVISFTALIIAIGAWVFFASSEQYSDPSQEVRSTAHPVPDVVAVEKQIDDEWSDGDPQADEAEPWDDPGVGSATPLVAEDAENRGDWHADVEGAYKEYTDLLKQTGSRYEEIQPDGCYSPDYYMTEMDLESPDPGWSVEMEKALYDLWRPVDTLNLNVDLSVRCYATLCRVVIYIDAHLLGDVSQNGELGAAIYAVQSSFRDTPTGEQFREARIILPMLANGDTLSIHTLVGQHRDRDESPAHCDNLML